MRSLRFFAMIEMSTRISTGGLSRPVRTADNLATFMCRLSRNFGSLSRSVDRQLFYLYLYMA